MHAFTLEGATDATNIANWECPATHAAVARLTVKLDSLRWATEPQAGSKRPGRLLPVFSFTLLFLIALLASSAVVVSLGYLGGRALHQAEWRQYSSGVPPQQWPNFSGR